MIIERHHHCHGVETLGIALIVFDGIYNSVEDVGRLKHLLRHGRCSLKEIVVVGIHTGNHVGTDILTNHIHQCRLLATFQFVARGQHHLEVASVILKLRERSTPEEDVVVAFHISHDTPPGFL